MKAILLLVLLASIPLCGCKWLARNMAREAYASQHPNVWEGRAEFDSKVEAHQAYQQHGARPGLAP